MSVSSVPSRIPSPSSFASSPISPASDFFPPYVVTRQSHPHLFSASPDVRVEPRPSYRKHGRYYFSDGNIIFLVDGMLYNVHRYFFQRDSSNFASMFSTIPHGGCGKGLTDDEPIVLPRVAAKDFDLFLSILYPSDFGVDTASTVAEWTAILDLAVNWNFKSIKALAIKKLACIASPIDKIVLGRKYDIEAWLGDAYEAVCIRDEPLTLEEGNRLGMEDVIKISATRQRVHGRAASLPLVNTIRETFGLQPLDVQEVIPLDVQGEKETISAPAISLPSCKYPATPLESPKGDWADVIMECQIASKKLTKAQQKKAEAREKAIRATEAVPEQLEQYKDINSWNL